MIIHWINLNIYALFFFFSTNPTELRKIESKTEIISIADLNTLSYKLKIYFTSAKHDSIVIDFKFLGKQFLCRDYQNYDYFISDNEIIINNLFDEHIIAQKIRTKDYLEKFEIPDTITGFSFTTNFYDYDEFFSFVQKLDLVKGNVNNDFSFFHDQENNVLYEQAKKIRISISLDKIKSKEITITDLRVENSLDR